MPKGRPFASTVFAQVGSRASINKALSRLVQSGTLERVARGVYMRPKTSKYTGRCGAPESAGCHGGHHEGERRDDPDTRRGAVRRLDLSTQMQVLPTFYTSGSTREIKIGNAVVRLRHASKNRLQHAGTMVGVALTALHYIGKEGLSAKVASKIASALSSEDLMKLQACKMPEWMRTALNFAAREM